MFRLNYHHVPCVLSYTLLLTAQYITGTCLLNLSSQLLFLVDVDAFDLRGWLRFLAGSTKVQRVGGFFQCDAINITDDSLFTPGLGTMVIFHHHPHHQDCYLEAKDGVGPFLEDFVLLASCCAVVRGSQVPSL